MKSTAAGKELTENMSRVVRISQLIEKRRMNIHTGATETERKMEWWKASTREALAGRGGCVAEDLTIL
jgi:hypothetical protein